MNEEIKRIKQALEFIAEHATGYGGQKYFREVMEILDPPNPKEFLECDACRAKPGSPQLCSGCLHNRSLIQSLKNN